MLRTGEKGKTYGLVKPGLKPSALKPSVFAQDDDDDDNADVNAQLREVSRKKLKQAEAEQARLQKEDPTVYDYDGVYEKMQATKQQAVPTKQPVQKSKYIGALMEKAKLGIAYDAKLQRERKNEDETYMGKEKFVTSAYKKKLQEDQMWKAEEARKAALEEDVTKKSDLGSFYKNLLDRNEAYGGIKEEKPEEKKKPRDERSNGDRKDRDNERGDRESENKDDESRKRGREEEEDRKENGNKKERSESKDKDSKQDGKEEVKKEDTKGDVKTEEQPKEETKEPEKEKEVRAPPKKLDEDAVSAAKLRYMQRKGLL